MVYCDNTGNLRIYGLTHIVALLEAGNTVIVADNLLEVIIMLNPHESINRLNNRLGENHK
ncbi:MAG: hypothetical protein PHT02_11770 [Tissierellia bacterium]|nr:hypothetical protein [Tissierellia bacterium]